MDYAQKRMDQAFRLSAHLREALRGEQERFGAYAFEVIISNPVRNAWEVRVEVYQEGSGFRSLVLTLNGDAKPDAALRVVLAAVEALP